MAADPSSQGVKLRNVGASGISRALVLVDGIPANDPFGGWVAWRAVPRLGLERIEIVPGGGSALYGNYALGNSGNSLFGSAENLAREARVLVGLKPDHIYTDIGTGGTGWVMMTREILQRMRSVSALARGIGLHAT